MRKIRLTQTSEEYFSAAWELYNQSFPIEERRLLSHQKEILNLDYYHFEVFVNDDLFVGIALWWEFEELKFIEHLATHPSLRRKGYGKLIIENFTFNDPTTILLEVELPENDVNKNRILFYQNLGFNLNLHPYYQPPLRSGSKPLRLLLMSFPNAISGDFVNDFIKNYHPKVYR